MIFGQHIVVMAEDRRDIESVRTGHAVVAGGTRDRVEIAYLVCQMHEQRIFFGGDRPQRRIGAAVLFEVFHISHARQHGKYLLRCTGIAECPFSRRSVDVGTFHLFENMRGLFRQTTAQQRLHDDTRNTTFRQLIVQVRSVRVTRVIALGIMPVEVVELDLHEIPMVLAFVMPFEQHIEDTHIAVVGETEITDASFLFLLHKPIEDAVVHIAGVKGLKGVFSSCAATDTMQQQVIHVVGAQVIERALEHRL